MTGQWEEKKLPDGVRPESDWLEELRSGPEESLVTIRFNRDSLDDLQGFFNGGDVKMNSGLRGLHDLGIRATTNSRWPDLKDIDRDAEGLNLDFVISPEKRAALFELGDSNKYFVSAVHPALPGIIDIPLPPDDGRGLELDDDAVITAIIDDGIGVANHRFREAAGRTRILGFADMDVGSDKDAKPRVWNSTDLETKFSAAGEEEGIYRAMEMIVTTDDRRQPVRFGRTHGTHILDLLSGYDFGVPDDLKVARKRPIVAVQLPSIVVEDRSDSNTAAAVGPALKWIGEFVSRLNLSRKAKGKAKLPLVLNFSFGVFAGPHDGSSAIETKLSEFIRDFRKVNGTECHVVLPSGNGFQAQAVADIAGLPAGESQDVDWRVQPDDRTSSFVQIWLPPSRPTEQQIEVTLIPPRDGPPIRVGSKSGYVIRWTMPDRETPNAGVYHQRVRLSGGSVRERVTICILPTAQDGGTLTTCPAGLWKIRIKNRTASELGPISLRVQRDDPVSFRRRMGRQSYFEDSDYVRLDLYTGRRPNSTEDDDALVTRKRTISAYATGPSPVMERDGYLVVGGYRRADGAPAIYSAAGPTSGRRTQPDLAAPTEESPSHGGVLATGTLTGSVRSLNGTSVASPLAARELANWIARGKTVEQFLKHLAKQDTGLSGPHGLFEPLQPDRMGSGRLSISHHRSRRRIEGRMSR